MGTFLQDLRKVIENHSYHLSPYLKNIFFSTHRKVEKQNLKWTWMESMLSFSAIFKPWPDSVVWIVLLKFLYLCTQVSVLLICNNYMLISLSISYLPISSCTWNSNLDYSKYMSYYTTYFSYKLYFITYHWRCICLIEKVFPNEKVILFLHQRNDANILHTNRFFITNHRTGSTYYGGCGNAVMNKRKFLPSRT
jgi:hypothetical protein